MFEWLFKYPADVYRQAEFAFASGLAPVWWLLIALAGAAVVAASALRGERLARWRRGRRLVVVGLQATAVSVVVAVLAEPTLTLRQLKPGANTVAVLVDASASMELASGEEPSRIALARRLVEGEIVPSVAARSKVALFRFHEESARVDSLDTLTADGDRTRLFEALQDVTRGFEAEALAAVIVLTDGADNSGHAPSDLAGLAAAGVPVHVIGIGPERNIGDVELSEVRLAPSAPPDSVVTARLTLRHAAAGDVRIRVRDGEALLAAKTVPLPLSGAVVTTDVELPSGAPGLRELTFEIVPPAGDPLPRNDTQRRLLTVGERRHRVLYLEGEPRWEYKFLRRAAAEDESMEVVSWLRTTPRKTYRQGVSGAEELGAGFPESLAALYEYDLVVLGSLPATALDDEAHAWLESFVAQRGGGLLALAGRHALADGGWDITPLAKALPVVLDRGQGPTYRFVEGAARPAPESLTSPLVHIAAGESDAWATLPRLADYQALGARKPGATVLLEWLGEGEPAPLLVEQPYGFGRTAVLATATTWRWRMRTPPEDPRHTRFWRQLLRHLAHGAQPRRKLSVDPGGDGLALRLALRDERFEPVVDAQVRARIAAPDGEILEASLGVAGATGAFGATVGATTPGVYRVDVTTTSGTEEHTVTQFARVGGADAEYFGATLNRPLLERIADATGGRYWAPENVAGIAQAVALGGVGVREQRVLPLWDAPFFYLMIVLLKCIEWSLRRWWGSI